MGQHRRGPEGTKSPGGASPPRLSIRMVGRQREFGIETGPIAIDMAGVYARKRDMVDGIIQVHLDKYRAAKGSR